MDTYESRNSRNNHVAPVVDNRVRNLTVKSPYFRNGLVKAKLSWLVSDSNSLAASSINSASINSIVIEQPVFTITWFPIKCSSDSLTTLSTPITASTINTNFEIYELVYNCDYVVNVRLEAASKSESHIGSSSLNPAPPQIASAQFKVPGCKAIQIVGLIRPRCYIGKAKAPKVTEVIKYATNKVEIFDITVIPCNRVRRC